MGDRVRQAGLTKDSSGLVKSRRCIGLPSALDGDRSRTAALELLDGGLSSSSRDPKLYEIPEGRGSSQRSLVGTADRGAVVAEGDPVLCVEQRVVEEQRVDLILHARLGWRDRPRSGKCVLRSSRSRCCGTSKAIGDGAAQLHAPRSSRVLLRVILVDAGRSPAESGSQPSGSGGTLWPDRANVRNRAGGAGVAIANSANSHAFSRASTDFPS